VRGALSPHLVLLSATGEAGAVPAACILTAAPAQTLPKLSAAALEFGTLNREPGASVASIWPAWTVRVSLRCIAGLDRGYPGRIDAPEAVAAICQEPARPPWRTLADEMMALFVRLRDETEATTVSVTHAAEAQRLATRAVGLDGPPARVVSDRVDRPKASAR